MFMNPIFNSNPTPLHAEAHKAWSIEPVQQYAFARDTNSVYLMAVEMVLASKEYPILFARQADGIVPIVLLGVESDNNQFVIEGGHWNANYIPAYVRRYPFIPAVVDGSSDTLTVCVDQDYAGLYQHGEAGLPLFEEDGTPASITAQAITLLQSYHGEHQNTVDFCEQLEQLCLLEEARLEVNRRGGEESENKQQALSGFLRINQERFLALDGGALEALRDSGGLERVYAHFQSLDNLKRLL
jgi:hypothetical protein